MSQNIFQVLDEQHIDEILEDHQTQITIIMFSSKPCPHCKMIKPKFVDLAKQEGDCFFIYVDITNFKTTKGTYTKALESTPYFAYYIHGQQLANITGAHEQALVKTLHAIKEKIATKQQSQTQSQEQPQDIAKKIEVLNKLRLLGQRGGKLTKNYNLESDYDELLLEYERITKPTQDQQAQLLKKQEQMKQIQDLNRVNQQVQMQQMYKIQQLKQLQKMKEEQERKEKKEGGSKDV